MVRSLEGLSPVEFFTQQYRQIIMPPIVGTTGGDAQPVISFITDLAEVCQGSELTFHLFITQDQVGLAEGLELDTRPNIELHVLDVSLADELENAPDHQSKIKQLVADITKKRNVGGTYMQETYERYTPKVREAYQQALTELDLDPESTLQLGHQGSYTHFSEELPVQFVNPYFFYSPDSGLISQTVFPLWSDHRFASVGAAFLRKIYSMTLGLNGEVDLGTLTDQSILPPQILAHEQVLPEVPAAHASALHGKIVDVLLGQQRPVDLVPAATQEVVKALKHFKEDQGKKVAFFSVSSSVLDSAREITALAKIFDDDLLGDDWVLVVQTSDERVMKAMNRFAKVVCVDYAHYPTILKPELVDLTLVSAGLGTAHEVVASGVPSILLSMPLLPDQAVTAKAAESKVESIAHLSYFDLAKKKPEALVKVIHQVLQATDTEIAQRTRAELRANQVDNQANNRAVELFLTRFMAALNA